MFLVLALLMAWNDRTTGAQNPEDVENVSNTPPVPPLPATVEEIYQDFRGKRPLLPSLRWAGPDADMIVQPEEAGLRIALPSVRPDKHPVGVATQFALSGDFEITGGYEMLGGAVPEAGNIGVALNLDTSTAPQKFAKLGYFLRAGKGACFIFECWNKADRNAYRYRQVYARARNGQLRLRRHGSMLYCLIVDGPGDDFREINRAEFGTDDLMLVRLAAAQNNTETAVQVRLFDFKIRANGILGAAAAAGGESGRRGWLALAAVLLLTVFGLYLVCFLIARRRRMAALPAPSPAPEQTPTPRNSSSEG